MTYYLRVERGRFSRKVKSVGSLILVTGMAAAAKGVVTESFWMLVLAAVLLIAGVRTFQIVAGNNHNRQIAKALKEHKGIDNVRVFRPYWGFTGSRKGFYVEGHFFPDEDYHEYGGDVYHLWVTIDVDYSYHS